MPRHPNLKQLAYHATSLFQEYSSSSIIMDTLVQYSLTFFFTLFLLYNHPETAGAVGINYGLLGDNLPPPSMSVSRLQQIKVSKIRLLSPDKDVLTALHNSGISVIVGTSNEDLPSLAYDPSVAAAWVEANILPHISSVNFTCVAAGKEVYPASSVAQFVPAAMWNLDAALRAANLSIPVSTSVSMATLSTSHPPSAGAFSDDAAPLMRNIAQFLSSKKYPLLVNVYPYFARAGDANVKLEYALFQKGDTAVRDGPNTYLNLFDAMTDAAYAALEKVGVPDVEIIVSETGWPSGGGVDASVENARTYVNNLIKHVSSGEGTPMRPGKEIEAYVSAMFNENQKPAGVEQNWGLHYPNLTEVYHVDSF